MKTDNSNTENDFIQLCVWPACKVGNKKKQLEFLAFMKETFDVRVKYADEVLTLPDASGKGGRNDLFFYVHNEDIPKFAVKRLPYGISWWEDIKGDRLCLYNNTFRIKYPKTW